MSPTRTAALLAAAGVLSMTGGCGGTTGPGASADSSPAPTPTTLATPATATMAPASTAPATPASSTSTPTKKPTAAPARGGDGDATDAKAPSTAGGGVCSHLAADQVGAILGVPVEGSAVPDETGCTFEQGGRKGTTVTVLDKTAAQAGGMDGAKAEANSAVEGEPQDLSGIGSAAFLVTGSMFGGPDVNAAGAVQVGSRIISVYLEQHSGIDEARVRTMETDLLRLVAKARS
jgi:hypothetical protein